MTDSSLDDAIQSLLGHLPPGTQNMDLAEELVRRIVDLSGKGHDRGELKILSSSLRDFSKSFEVFGDYRHVKKISLFGSARCPEDSAIYQHCKAFSAAAVAKGYMLITGAGPGIMQAGNEGATREKSFGVSIQLPFEASANPIIDGDPKLIEFKYFFARKLSFLKESAAIVLFPGGFGTLDEGYEALTLLQTGKADPLPVIMMDLPGGDYWPSWERYQRENLLRRGLISEADRNLYRFTSDIDKAIEEIDRFYRCYHSIRYVGKNTTILRLTRVPTPELIELLNERYSDLLAEGKFEIMKGPHPAERGLPETVQALPRIGFKFVRRGLGRLRRMIDEINMADLAPAGDTVPPRGTGAWRVQLSENGDEGA